MVIKKNKHNIIQNKVKRYNNLFYSNGPVKIEDFLNNTYNIVHSEIYMYAIKKYLSEKYNINLEEDIEDFLETHKLIELKNEEYNLPGKVLIITRSYPYKKDVVDLTDYWNYYSFNENNKDILRKIDKDDENTKDAEITYINYITGECEMESRNTGYKFKVSFKEINENTPISDEYSLRNTYHYKLKNGN